MTGHVCPNCGANVPCDKRLIGTGRKKPLTGALTANHQAVFGFLQANQGRTLTADGWREQLNAMGVVRQGRRNYWFTADIQNILSDLVGRDMVNMFEPTAATGRAWLYRFKVPIPTEVARA